MAAGQAVEGFLAFQEIVRELKEIHRAQVNNLPTGQLLKKYLAILGEFLQADLVVLFQAASENPDALAAPIAWGKMRSRALQKLLHTRSPHTPKNGGRRRTPLYLNNADKAWQRLVPVVPELDVRQFVQKEEIVATIALPLRADHRRLGVLLINYRQPVQFSLIVKEISTWLADQILLTLHTTNTQEQEHRLVRQISAAINSEDGLTNVGEKILDELARVVGFKKASMQLIQGDIRFILAYRGFGAREIDPALLRPISKDALIKRVTQADKPYILEDVSSDPDWKPRRNTRNIKSWVGVPIRFAGELLGLITLDHDQAGYYTQAVENILTWFADQAAIAVNNAHLFDSARRRIHDLRILNEIGGLMGSQLKTTELLTTIVKRIRAHLECTHCTIFFPKPLDHKIMLHPTLIAGQHSAAIRSRIFKPDEGLVGWVYQHGKSLRLDDARSHPHFAPPRNRRGVPRSMLVVPILIGGHTAGVISADQDAYGWFDDSDLHFLEALARQAGIAIQRNRGLELLGKIEQRINTTQNIEELLKLIVEASIEMANVTSGVIYLISPDGRHIQQSYKFPPQSFHPAPRLDKANGLTRQIIATGRMLKFNDLSRNKRINPALRGQVASMLALPLKHEQQVVGVLFLNDQHRHKFTETEMALLMTLANQAATALYKAELLEDLRRQVQRHRTLNEVGLHLIGQHVEQQILDVVARSTLETLECRHCTVFRVAQDEIIVAASQGKLQAQLPIGRAFPLGHGIAGWVAQKGQEALVSNTEQDERFEASWTEPHPLSLVNVPIMLNHKVYGVISAEDLAPQKFDAQDLRLMQTFALQISQALRNARQIAELEALNQAGRAISSKLERDALLETLLKTVKEILNCLTATLFILGPDNELVALTRQGPAAPDLAVPRFKLGQGLAGWVAKERKALVVPDVRKDKRFIPPSSIPWEAPHSMLLAPMISNDRLIGVISVDKDIVGGFNESDQRLLETLAAQAAGAYETAQFFQASRQQTAELTLLHEVGVGLNTLDLNALLTMIIKGAMTLTHTEIGVIYLFSTDGERIVHALSQPANFSPVNYNLSNQGITRLIYTSGEPYVVPDIEQEARVSSQIRKMDVRSFIGLPLKVGEQVLGVLYLNDRQPHAFTPAELNLGATLASQAASAIINARLFSQTSKNAEAMRRLTQIVQTIGAEQDPFAALLAEAIQIFQNANYGSFALVEPAAERLVYQTVFQQGRIVSKEQLPLSRRVRDWTVGLMGQVARGGQARLTGDVSQEPAYHRWRESTVSEMVVPLKGNLGQVIGVLNLESAERDAFSPSDLELCQDLANAAVIAWEKSRLYQDLEQRVGHLNALSAVAQQVSGLPAQQEILEVVVRIARETLKAVRCTLFVLGEGGTLVPRAASGISPEEVRLLAFRPGEGLAGWVVQQGHSFRTPDANADAHFIRDQHSRPDRARPMLLAPLWSEGKVIGVLSVDRDGGPGFDQDDQRFLEILSLEAGIFLMRRQRLEAVRRRFNPYIVGRPVRDPRSFFGRTRLLQNILDGIHNNNYIIYGERRIGKTSLLLQIERSLRDLLEHESEDYLFVPVFCNLQGISEAEFFHFIARQLHQTTAIPLTVSTERPFDQNDLQDYLDQVAGRFSLLGPHRPIRIVLLLDEMDVFMDYSQGLHERFRSIFMSPTGEYLRMVAAGLTVQRVQTHTSPWFNLPQIFELLPLNEEEARELVTVPVGGYYAFELQALDTLLAMSNLKPMEIQRLAYRSISALLERILPRWSDQEILAGLQVEAADVALAIQQTLSDKTPEYEDFWQALTPKQQRALRQAGRAAADPFGTGLFTREQLYNVTYPEAGQLRLTELFKLWLKGRPA